MLAEITIPAPVYNPPAFNYQPKHGSYGQPPMNLRRHTVSATILEGGFPATHDDFDPNYGKDYTPTEIPQHHSAGDSGLGSELQGCHLRAYRRKAAVQPRR